jgi:stress-induced morphogen
MTRSQRIESQLQGALCPLQLQIENESSQHSVPPGSETHFKVLIVCEKFEGLNRVDRQRQVYGLLDAEFKSGLHALTVRALSPSEWEKQGADNFISPNCQGAKS